VVGWPGAGPAIGARTLYGMLSVAPRHA